MPAAITALLLAGGRGTRMGGVDKGLQAFNGTPLALHALRRLRQQTLPPAELAINANRQRDDYRAFGVPVWPDSLPGFPGPLAGFLTGLAHCRTPLLLTLPCDVPRFPLSLCERLAQALQAPGADIAVASTERAQPVFCLMRAGTGLHDDLTTYLAEGGRQVEAWTARHRRVVVPFDDPRAFANANTLPELRALERQTPTGGDNPCPHPPSAC
ncbi:MAG: molybdenum cofactor guanylyltransferase MobA [Ottowia sp.]|uniref:molybdenum cofactor guanylyltransferase MobA n=1 Tax=Ottowia sp. TaxID=1898956 RepID=UPI0039E32BA7